MADNSFLSDDPGTILDSSEKPLVAPPQEIPYRSPHHWAAPRLVICDDGSTETGEVVYIRSDRFLIGRTQGDIMVGHDAAMSGTHAEIARRDVGGKFAWILRDLGSANGTFARASSVTLRAGLAMLLGSKRYRFELPRQASAAGTTNTQSTGTVMVQDFARLPDELLSALVETQTPTSAITARYPLRAARVALGRPGYGNGIEIDDPCLARAHAIISRDAGGTWQLAAQPSLNGVWVKIDNIRLTNNCQFQCGEQRFRFRFQV